MSWDVEFTDEFGGWYESLTEGQQDAIDRSVALLEARGVTLMYPHTSGIKDSRHGQMRELRVQHAGRPLRILYAFDPRRVAILLIGGEKTGDDRWYEEFVPVADKLYDAHIETLERE